MDKLCSEGYMKSDHVGINFLNHCRFILAFIYFYPFRPHQFQEDNASIMTPIVLNRMVRPVIYAEISQKPMK